MRFVIVCGALFLASTAALADCVNRARVVVQQAQVLATPVLAVQPLAVAVPHYSVGYSADGDTAATLRELLAEIRSLRQALIAAPVGPPKEETVEARAVAVLTARCASCHTGAESKGKNVIFSAPGQLNPNVDRFMLWAKADSGEMPPPPHAIVSDEETGILKSWLKESIKARKAATPK